MAAVGPTSGCSAARSTDLPVVSGVAENVSARPGSGHSVYDSIQAAKECGVNLYVCPSSLELHEMKLEDCIPELDGAMGAAGYATMGLQDDVVVFCY